MLCTFDLLPPRFTSDLFPKTGSLFKFGKEQACVCRVNEEHASTYAVGFQQSNAACTGETRVGDELLDGIVYGKSSKYLKHIFL